ncbi:MAG: glycoside hydrolase family 16 protein [Spirochaetes bacterium]|nr:glycoside hydrolase family 16 protein [Spirochaetota bacterium]
MFTITKKMALFLSIIIFFFLFFQCATVPEEKGGKGESGKKTAFFDDKSDPDIGDTNAKGVFYDTFNSEELDKGKWTTGYLKRWGHTEWGGLHPGLVKLTNGMAVLEVHGDMYEGDFTGYYGTKKRVGAVIATKDRFASGRYEVKAMICPEPEGIFNAFWTFYYRKYRKGTKEYERGIEQGNVERGGYIIKNHEIDFEIFGPDFTSDLMTTWIGDTMNESVSVEADWGTDIRDRYHIFRFDWHTGSKKEKQRVDFYLDGKLVYTLEEMIPTVAGQFWCGIWFPNWVGEPKFDTGYMYIDWVKITPFFEEGDELE